jgi:serine/threonine protein kinase
MSGAPGSRAGSMFGPYELKRPLGRGAMGEVYEAEHTVKGWTVALKLMSESVSSDPVFRERMKREARITGRLQEPHVVPIHDYGEIDGRMFLEMRLIEGTDLDSLLKRSGPLSPPRAVAITTQIASALDAAHAAKVMHRDVKPSNILVTPDDFAYLLDFGIASATTDEKLTQLGYAIGTWKYMAPERFSNEAVDQRADVYSLACVLYECLTGVAPYRGENAGVLVGAHLNEPVPRPSVHRSGIPTSVDRVISRGMAKGPADRYGSAGELAHAAHEALTTPDRNQTVDILRRSAEVTLPPGPRSARSGRPSNASPPPNASPPVGLTRAPDSGPNLVAPSPPYFQQHWGAPPPSAPQPIAHPAPWGRGHQPLPPPPRGRNPGAIVAGAAAVVVVLIAAAIGVAVAMKGDDDIPNAGTTTTAATTTTSTTARTTSVSPSTPPPGAEQQLLSVLPSGYPPGTCKSPAQPMPGSAVSVMCGPNTDPNGPTVSAYGLFTNLKALQDAFTGFTGSDTLLPCPGGKASPGTWWHTKDPNIVLGQLACGTYKGDEPQVLWSNQQTMVFALIGGKPQGPNLDQLYKWWTSHS